jgi:hypothetical protein
MKCQARQRHRRRQTGPRSKLSRSDLQRLSEDELLNMRICDLGVRIEGTPLVQRIDRLYRELAAKRIRFRPHFWLSDEWFTPDGVPGTAIPFYLAHPRLMRLEAKQMLEVEGGTEEWCMRILRHEAGHAIDNAYRLHRRRRWQEVFGKASEPYPEFYKPKPYSKSYVLHLDMWYAQSHPVEDFAETFAVWLKPRSRWRTRYQGWPALEKLKYVDELIAEIRGRKPRVNSRERVEPLRAIRKTLREHYEKKRTHYELDYPNFYDGDLRRLFSDSLEHAGFPSAATFLRRKRRELRKAVAYWTGEYQYTIDQVLSEMIARSRELDLHLMQPEAETERDALILLTIQTMNYLHAGHHRVAL